MTNAIKIHTSITTYGYIFLANNIDYLCYLILQVDDSHAGEYTCTPYNDLGTNGPSPRMHVIVQRAPVFTITPHSLYLKKVGDTVVMHCDAVENEGVERPTIAWYRVSVSSNTCSFFELNL